MKLFNTMQIIIGFIFQGMGVYSGLEHGQSIDWGLVALGNLTMQVGTSMMYLYDKPLKKDGKHFNNIKTL